MLFATYRMFIIHHFDIMLIPIQTPRLTSMTVTADLRRSRRTSCPTACSAFGWYEANIMTGDRNHALMCVNNHLLE